VESILLNNLDVLESLAAPSAGNSPTEGLLRAQQGVLEKIVRGAPLNDVLADLTRIIDVLDDREAVAAILLVDDQGRLRTGAAPGLPDDYNAAIDGLQAREDLGTCSIAAVTGRTVITPDIDGCPYWQEIKALPLALGLVAAWSQPILSSDGKVVGTFGTYFRDKREPTALERHLVETLAHTAALAIERDGAQRAIQQRQRLLDRAMEAAGMGAWRYNPQTSMCEFSLRAQELYGVTGPDFLHDEDGVQNLLHPDDVPAMWAAVAKAIDPAGDGRYVVEYRTHRRDGGWRWLSVWGLAEFEGVGAQRRVCMLVGASRDITEQKDAERQQALLMDELSHRVKNNLAVVQAMASQTLRHATDPSMFAGAFMDRLSALASAHNLLTQSVWTGAELRRLAEVVLSPFVERLGNRELGIEGPDVSVSPSTAVTLALVLHELATNASKYGALSTAEGRIELSWTLQQETARQPVAQLQWREFGGPPVKAPTRKGFGSRLIQSSAAQLEGAARLDYRPDGLQAVLTFVTDGRHVSPLRH
jgi:two-component sensor histidine kinase/PAS domain-containing protein